MAGARKRDYAAEYKRRVERGLKSGKTRQQARGHVVREHVRRAERETERQGLTNAQIRIVFQWGEKRSFIAKDHEITGLDYVEAAQSSGYEWFKNYRKIWEAARRTYVRELHNGTYASRGMAYLESLTSQANANDVSWLYYH